MKESLDSAIGKVFIHPVTRSAYGPIREPFSAVVSSLSGELFDVLADDTCGNCFTVAVDGSVKFWDHETDEQEHLAHSVREFIAGCTDPPELVLDPNQVLSVWVKPEFAKSLGLEVPEDGWVKKSSTPK